MRFTRIGISFLLVLLPAFTAVEAVSAHQAVTQGPYKFEIGWLNEPPIRGQMNAIVMNVAYSNGSADPVPYDGTNLILTISIGGQSTALPLQQVDKSKPGQYIAPILPTAAGTYTVNITGSIGNYDDIELEVKPEAVLQAQAAQFPPLNDTSRQNPFGWTDGIAIAALLISLGALAGSILALRKRG